ncbi:GNAT family N-acetyltransferase [Virgibacillus sp. W0430]|uniref:GNAT family N-acetyltransferase n=1 Tax=Virgibacillus sp. W0430 TaxID=3391580 RepID=UPI003F445BFE
MKIQIAETQKEKKDALYVRTIVFVNEQQVPPELEVDEHDETSIHIVGYLNNNPVAAGRLRFVDEYGKLERICVLKEQRGKAYGKHIIQHMESVISDHGYQKAKLNAQTHAERFYNQLGYQTISDEFMDAGIPHVTMVKTFN